MRVRLRRGAFWCQHQEIPTAELNAPHPLGACILDRGSNLAVCTIAWATPVMWERFWVAPMLIAPKLPAWLMRTVGGNPDGRYICSLSRSILATADSPVSANGMDPAVPQRQAEG